LSPTNRIIQVKIGNTLSEKTHIENGVPQVNIIAPILFLIYINDFPIDNAHNITPSIFADDFAFWKDGRNLNHITKSLQTQLDKISQWSGDWGLKLNPTKTVEVIFTYKRLKIMPKFKLLGKEITTVISTTFLTFHNHLNWKQHIANVVKKQNLPSTYYDPLAATHGALGSKHN